MKKIESCYLRWVPWGNKGEAFHIVVPPNWAKPRLLGAIPEGSSLPGGGQEQRGDRLKLTLERRGTRKSLGIFKARSSGLASYTTSKGPRAREGSLDPTLCSVVPDIKSSLTQNLWEGAGLLYSSQLYIA